jgi:membrane associated rhomboid family serine protease
MRSASVGFQCPDDVAAGAKSVRPARTAFGGRLSGDTSRVTIALIGLNLAAHVVGLLVGGGDLPLRFGNLAGPAFIGPDEVGGVADGEYYRLVTAAFLHAGLLHLALNMFALASLGPVLESALGRVRFLALYLLSALGGSTLSFLLSDRTDVGVGASGAIFGLFGAFYVVARKLGGDTRSILTLLLINLVITFAVPFIDWRAHLGGLITGTLVAAALAFAPRGARRTSVQAAACVGVLLLLVVIVAVRSQMLTG